jgi:hypothetical protein
LRPSVVGIVTRKAARQLQQASLGWRSEKPRQQLVLVCAKPIFSEDHVLTRESGREHACLPIFPAPRRLKRADLFLF